MVISDCKNRNPAWKLVWNLGIKITGENCVELYSKMGAEGQTSHAENTIARSYESAGISPSLLAEITPKVEVIS